MMTRTKLASVLTVVLAVALPAVLPAVAATHFVQQTNFAFSPAVVTINVGDTVTWQWANFSHTVTSGTGSADPLVGQGFDAPLNTLNRTFSHTFAAAGTFPYFCRPHELMGMAGTVIVQAASGVDQVPARGTLSVAGAPNPFNPRTVISFVLPSASPVTLTVHDAAGRLVRSLLDGETFAAGRGEVAWDGLGDDGHGMPAGVYLATVEAAGLRESLKLALAK